VLPPILPTATELLRAGERASAVRAGGGGGSVLKTCWSAAILFPAGAGGGGAGDSAQNEHPHCPGVLGVLRGQWRDFLAEGEGRCTYSNGDVEEGQWRADCRHGKGVQCRHRRGCAGGTYAGSFEQHQKSGEGGRAPSPRAPGEWLRVSGCE
jgi:hypothetical protein